MPKAGLRSFWITALAAGLAAFSWACWPTARPRLGPPPTPVGNPSSEARVALGRMLFFDPVLSGNQKMACATCHNPAAGFTDPRVFSIGSDGHPRPRRTPSVANLAYVHSFFADGRAGSLEEQMLEPMLAQSEMAGDPDQIRARLKAIPEYRELFARAFPGDSIDLPPVAKAIAAYERTLVINDTPYDRWAAGDASAMSAAAQRGLRVFNGKGVCAECHPAPLFGSDDLDPIGTPDRDAKGRLVSGTDPGLSKQSARHEDFGAFRATILRTAAAEGPYMHNAVFRTLEEVVDFYDQGGSVGLGLAIAHQDEAVRKLNLTRGERADLIAFLRALHQDRPVDRLPERVPSGLTPGGGTHP